MFPVGAFGQETIERSDLVPMEQKCALEKIGRQALGNWTFVNGDTTRDVLSTKYVSACSIALTIGTDDRELLGSVNPDYIFNGLDETLDILMRAGEVLGGKNGI